MTWSKATVESFAEVATGGTPSTDNIRYWEGGTIPWLNSGDLNQGKVTQAFNFITEEGYNNSSARMMPPDTVLIALTGSTTGLAAILKFEACANQSVTGIFPSERHHPEFLYYFFKTQRKRILDSAWGGAQPHISQQFIKDYIVPLPPLVDQIKIAAILSKAESLINLRKQNLKLLDDFLKGTFIKMFGDPVRNPNKNELVKLGELGTWRSGGTPSRSNAAYFNGNIPWATSGELDKLFIEDTKERISAEAVQESGAKLIEEDSLLLGMYDTAALKSSIAKKPLTCNQAIAYAKLDNQKCNVIYAYFNVQVGRDYFKRQQRGVRQQNMNLGMIRDIMIMLPDISEQNRFADIVMKAEMLRGKLKAGIRDLEDLFLSLSQRMFREDFDLSKVDFNRLHSSLPSLSESIPNIDERPLVQKRKPIAQPQPVSAQYYGGGEAIVNWEWLGHRIRERYKGLHFNFEMIMNFVKKEKLSKSVHYYSSEEMKANPKLNETDDIKTFIQTAIRNVPVDDEQHRKANPFLTLTQSFYNAEDTNLSLRLHNEDSKLFNSKPLKYRSGMFFLISSDNENN